MSSTQIVVIILVVVAIAVLAWLGARVARRRSLRKRFGPEYDRVVAERDSRPAAERELRDRERRHADLELKPLSDEARARYAAAWEEVQVRFVDTPADAVGTADELVTRLITERGYPKGDDKDQVAQLSVEHARTLGHYRDAREINRRNDRGQASTEDLRQALVHYRALFADLLGENPIRSDPTGTHNARRPGNPDGYRPDASR
jgi:ribosomal protein L13E